MDSAFERPPSDCYLTVEYPRQTTCVHIHHHCWHKDDHFRNGENYKRSRVIRTMITAEVRLYPASANGFLVNLKSFLPACQLSGTFPYDSTINVSWLFNGIALVVLCYLGQSVFSVLVAFNSLFDKDQFGWTSWVTNFCLVVLPYVHFLKIHGQRKRLRSFLESMSENQDLLTIYGGKLGYGSVSWIIMVIVAKCSVTLFLAMTHHSYVLAPLIPDYSIYGHLLIWITAHTIQTQILYMFKVISLQFNSLINVMKRNVKNVIITETLALAHFQLCSLTGEIMKVYSYQILCIVAFDFCTLFGCTNTLLSYLSKYMFLSQPMPMEVVLVQLGFIFYSLIDMRLTTYLPSVITTKACDFNRCLHRIMLSDSYKDLKKSKKLKFQLSLNRKAVLKVCDLFSLEYTMIHSVLATCLNYLVIFFKMPTAA